MVVKMCDVTCFRSYDLNLMISGNNFMFVYCIAPVDSLMFEVFTEHFENVFFQSKRQSFTPIKTRNN